MPPPAKPVVTVYLRRPHGRAATFRLKSESTSDVQLVISRMLLHACSSALTFEALESIDPKNVFVNLLDAHLLMDAIFDGFCPGGQPCSDLERDEFHVRLGRLWRRRERALGVAKLRQPFAAFAKWFSLRVDDLMRDRPGFVGGDTTLSPRLVIDSRTRLRILPADTVVSTPSPAKATAPAVRAATAGSLPVATPSPRPVTAPAAVRPVTHNNAATAVCGGGPAQPPARIEGEFKHVAFEMFATSPASLPPLGGGGGQTTDVTTAAVNVNANATIATTTTTATTATIQSTEPTAKSTGTSTSHAGTTTPAKRRYDLDDDDDVFSDDGGPDDDAYWMGKGNLSALLDPVARHHRILSAGKPTRPHSNAGVRRLIADVINGQYQAPVYDSTLQILVAAGRPASPTKAGGFDMYTTAPARLAATPPSPSRRPHTSHPALHARPRPRDGNDAPVDGSSPQRAFSAGKPMRPHSNAGVRRLVTDVINGQYQSPVYDSTLQILIAAGRPASPTKFDMYATAPARLARLADPPEERDGDGGHPPRSQGRPTRPPTANADEADLLRRILSDTFKVRRRVLPRTFVQSLTTTLASLCAGTSLRPKLANSHVGTAPPLPHSDSVAFYLF